MLKKIKKTELKPGMFVEHFEGLWQDNPLAKRRFLLESNEQAEMLKNSNLDGVIINTALGSDVPPSARKNGGGEGRKASHGASHFQQRKIAAQKMLSQFESAVADLFWQVKLGEGLAVDVVSPVVAEISQAVEQDPIVFLSLVRLKLKDETTFMHSVGVSALMMQFARYMKSDADIVHTLGISGLLHDIGKMKLPDEILKKQSRLTEDEFALIRSHPVKGHKVLQQYPEIPEIALDICLHHHERVDGKGYPDALTGEQLSTYVRMSTICDVFEALTSIRPYKKAWTRAETLSWMLNRDGHFDRHLLHHFVASLEKAAYHPSQGQ